MDRDVAKDQDVGNAQNVISFRPRPSARALAAGPIGPDASESIVAHGRLLVTAEQLKSQLADFRAAANALSADTAWLDNLCLSVDIFRLALSMIDPRRLPPRETLKVLTHQAQRLGQCILEEVGRFGR
jgi:hypothetical protein